jgi:hypothetical protein
VQGIVAVMFTVLNRANIGHRGRSITECCLAAQQYSCWNDRDPQQAIGLRLAQMLLDSHSLEHEPDAMVLMTCLYLAKAIVHRYPWPVPDPSHGAISYFNPRLVSHIPNWSKAEFGAVHTTTIGAHEFYKNIA